jgi:hypothetical protein
VDLLGAFLPRPLRCGKPLMVENSQP